MSEQKSPIRQRLREMAQLTILSNRMSEVQANNLKHYPFVFFNGVEAARVEFDLSKVDDEGKMRHGEHHVTYHLELDEERNEYIDKRFIAIENAVRSLFWNDLKVKVFINDKLAYESKDE